MSSPDKPVTHRQLQDALQDALATQKQQIVDEVTQKFNEATELMRSIETNLLTEFHRYAKGQTSRNHALETRSGDMELRLHQIEERLLELEGRIRPKH